MQTLSQRGFYLDYLFMILMDSILMLQRVLWKYQRWPSKVNVFFQISFLMKYMRTSSLLVEM